MTTQTRYSVNDITNLLSLLPSSEGILLQQGWELAQSVYSSTQLQTRLQALHLLQELQTDTPTLIASLLFQAVDSEQCKQSQIKQYANNESLQLINALAKLKRIDSLHDAVRTENEKIHAQQLENLRRLMITLTEDLRVLLILLAERLIQMRTLRELPQAQQQQLAQETLDLFSPLANRLGIGRIKWELEDLALRALKPTDYLQIANALNSRRQEREHYLQDIMARLQTLLSKANTQAEINGRPKHIYSIWKKMQRKQVAFSEIFDALAVRVLVDSVADCYTVLGLVHSLWTPIASEFDDYIAAPKSNGYRSLHTAVIGNEGKQFEVQIRTHEMHQMSELGVASHWRYKEGGKQDTAFEQKIANLRQFLESGGKAEQNDAEDEPDQARIYVLTPEGHVVELPAGATPLDFAYAIHTGLGHRCRGAKVNDRIVPLSQSLHNSDKVEVLADRQEHPRREWLNPHNNYLKTSRARAKVRHWLNQQSSEQHAQEGRTLLDHELRRLNLKDIPLDDLVKRYHCNDQAHLFARIGRGDVRMGQIANILQQYILPADKATGSQTSESGERTSAPESAQAPTSHPGISSQGVDGLLTHTAKCCHPLPGDEVIGYITRERGIAVHRRDCSNAQKWQEQGHERLIEVDWGASSKHRYKVSIFIRAYDRDRLLKDVSDTLTALHISVNAIQSSIDKHSHIAHMQISIKIHDIEQLSQVLQHLEELPNVIEATRSETGKHS
ncbi:bifunctional (p)ppGpp synthetase/guanosine-3',5'-bis(diphosphate) 3'-pyrophosphohydrolase [Candidatus Venteria ishoeyi]|uniref:RelA/SpoT family protein n=1 Tax=Candidatus Venteria ishoeyi TaxID=1899563 RepID=UPI0025A6243C|nr:bifunctional (p)ppGpp synthetase/guanosine-3',5'-bis(diphosphate) 3'-pyrophosphohydrolase [Candidatus Venteria ishoeyi]MDM8546910.1 bifunctional (p)ppGpp synthetase/guanosine-3',5'-bis(diphosphate) 3'-pyrophosphohydrolase [Candidatus Venteria ishoeyi]